MEGKPKFDCGQCEKYWRSSRAAHKLLDKIRDVFPMYARDMEDKDSEDILKVLKYVKRVLGKYRHRLEGIRCLLDMHQIKGGGGLTIKDVDILSNRVEEAVQTGYPHRISLEEATALSYEPLCGYSDGKPAKSLKEALEHIADEKSHVHCVCNLHSKVVQRALENERMREVAEEIGLKGAL